MNSILYGFIWNGKDKVKRQALISDLKKGGLKMLDIESMIKPKHVAFLKKFLEEYPTTWKTICLNIAILILLSLRLSYQHIIKNVSMRGRT